MYADSVEELHTPRLKWCRKFELFIHTPRTDRTASRNTYPSQGTHHPASSVTVIAIARMMMLNEGASAMIRCGPAFNLENQTNPGT